MTDEELDKLILLMTKDPSKIVETIASLTPADRAAINARMEKQVAESEAKSQREIQEIFRKAEADGTMDKIRAISAEDKARKSKKKTK